ncbi:hypothetical protein [Nocardia sp. NBC_01327]|uniref:hypothetical protein n=1 Tax=Nocardia sp. NBC_01327 TaxID=2903593 RepID=UPI002E12F86F|nr:hypothetical protein OG326_42450 [Nocardia sp. NBC_01327]
MSGQQSTGDRVTARQTARARMAEVAAANRKREEENTGDLTAFLKSSTAVERAATRRDAAIAAANDTYTAAGAAAEREQADALARIKNRGTSETDLAELAGLDVVEVRRLLRLVAPPKKATPKVVKPPATAPVAVAEPAAVLE